MRRELGLREAVALGVGGTVGGGIFVLVGVAAGQAGPAALLAFLLAFGASVAIALPYAELACRLPLAGGGYAFVRGVLGPHWGFLMGWGYWGAYVFLSGYVTLGFGGYLQAASGLPAPVGAVALVVACTVLNLLGVKVSGRAQAAVVLVAVVGLCGLVAWGLPGVELERLRPFAPHGAGGVVLAAQVAFLSFGGFDMVAAAGEEVRHPERNLPRAILLTLAAVLGLYLLVAFVALGTVPAGRLAASKAPLAAAAEAFGGTAARRLVVASALLTTAATANAVLVVTSRVAFAMGRDRLLPARLGAIHPRTDAPWVAVVVNGLLLAAVAAATTVSFAAAAGGLLYVLHFLPPLVALVLLRRRGGERPAFTTPAPRLLLPLAFAAAAALALVSGPTGLASGGGWLLLGLAAHGSRQLAIHRPRPREPPLASVPPQEHQPRARSWSSSGLA
jgi:APA family basic amino acid/polyamine antiporter